jgi:hypothetical protein
MRNFTFAMSVVVSPLSVVIVASLHPAGVEYIDTHEVSAGHSVSRAAWFAPYARRPPQQSV